ncbi:MAG: CotH kinase family protein [Clostridiales bacterium]|nr:CotH kinase family protein [Clostridiales bacterium]
MTKKRIVLITGILAALLLLTGCMTDMDTQTGEQPAADAEATRAADKIAVADINDLALTDDKTLYADQDAASLVYFYITVRGGNAADGTNHTFEEVNAYRNVQENPNVNKIKTGILFQIGDETGPLPGEIGYGETMNNASMNVRGRSSTTAPQKSYRIDLYNTAGLWRGQRAIAINKHPYDRTRLRNMLYFTLLQDVPDMTSLRTQFVQVFIKDETAGETAFTDYGLFTQVELPNGRYLRNHSLSRNGNLYKANYCEFYRYSDQLRLATDPNYDIDAFSEVLEPKTNEDHEKLLTILDDVNDYAVPIEETVGKYFDLDNVTSFLAYNILMGNVDTNSQNYLLYSPVNSDIWYFICWDGDGCLTRFETTYCEDENAASSWQRGVSNYWGMRLFNRMLRVDEYRDALREKMELLRGIITPERIAAEIAAYRTVVDTFTGRMPDTINLTCTLEQLEVLYQNMPYDVDTAYQDFLDSLKNPMPFFLDDVYLEEDSLVLSWGEAFSFEAETVHYTLEVATDWSFAPETLVHTGSPQLQLSESIPMPPAGDYCWRVTAQNENGYTQVAFDWFVTTDVNHYGMRRFTVTDAGEVLNAQ